MTQEAAHTWAVEGPFTSWARDIPFYQIVGEIGGVRARVIAEVGQWTDRPKAERDAHLIAAAPAMLAALEAIAEHQPERVYRTPEEVAEADACPECQRFRARSWPPLGLCSKHESVYYGYVHINDRAEKYHDLDLKHIARAAIAQARGEKVQGG